MKSINTTLTSLKSLTSFHGQGDSEFTVRRVIRETGRLANQFPDFVWANYADRSVRNRDDLEEKGRKKEHVETQNVSCPHHRQQKRVPKRTSFLCKAFDVITEQNKQLTVNKGANVY